MSEDFEDYVRIFVPKDLSLDKGWELEALLRTVEEAMQAAQTGKESETYQLVVDAERAAVVEARLAEIITELGVRPGTSHSFVMAHLRVHMNAASLYRDASNRLDRIDAALEDFRHAGPALPTTMLARIQGIVREKWASRKAPLAAEAVGDES